MTSAPERKVQNGLRRFLRGSQREFPIETHTATGTSRSHALTALPSIRSEEELAESFTQCTVLSL
jgi:hypothetical protein